MIGVKGHLANVFARSMAETPLSFDHEMATTTFQNLIQAGKITDGSKQARLLKYLIDCEAKSEGAAVTGYAIAFDVFGRKSDFDPAVESTVRVEMHRLRAILDSWRSDPRSRDGFFIDIEKRTNRILIHRRSGFLRAKFFLSSLSKLKKIFGILIILIILIAMVATILRHEITNNLTYCRSARPTVTIIGHNDLSSRISEFSGYYPMIKVQAEGGELCPGVPAYSLVRRMENGGSTQLVLRNLTEADPPLWIFKVNPEDLNNNEFETLLAAKVAFLMGHSQGVIAKLATRERWKDLKSFAEYRCLDAAFKYLQWFPKHQEIPVKKCLTDLSTSSKQADVPAVLGAVMLVDLTLRGEGAFNVGIYGEVMARSEAIDPNNLEYLRTRLLESRSFGIADRGLALSTVGVVDRFYRYEPALGYQSAIVLARLIEDFPAADQHAARAKQIQGYAFEVDWPEIFKLVHNNEPEKLGKYIAKLEAIDSPVSQIIALSYAVAVGDLALKKRLSARLELQKDTGYRRAKDALVRGGLGPSLTSKLLVVLDKAREI